MVGAGDGVRDGGKPRMLPFPYVPLNQKLLVSKALTNVQLEIVKAFQYELDERNLDRFRQHLASFFLDQLDVALDAHLDKQADGDDIVRNWETAHLRTPYPDR